MDWAHLLVIYFIGWVCSEDFLSKFHQTVYKIRDFRVELATYDESLTNKFEVVTFKHNRTTPAVNFTFSYKIDVEDRLLILSQYYKKASNEYRRYPIRYQNRFASAFDADASGLQQQLLKCGNVSKIYFLKDVTYHICNYVIDDSKLPPLIPVGEYMVTCDFIHLDRVLGVLKYYAELYIPVKYPSH